MIHPTAIISPGATIADDVEIGAFSIIGDDVTIGNGTWIGPHVVIDPHVAIASGCRIFQYAAIGAIPQDLKFGGEKSMVRIGPDVTIREFVTIPRGPEKGGGITEVGDNVILANAATLAGHITIGDHATVGGLVAIHQFVRIGPYAFVGGKSAVVKDVPPYVIAAGDRAILHGLNRVGLKRHGFSDQTLTALKKTYRILFRYGLTLNEAIQRVHAEVELLPEVNEFIAFIKASSRGATR